MKKDYKVEMKPSYWEVILSSGCYSDYEESHLFFAGNDENEIWNFLKRYVDEVAEESEYCWGIEYKTGVALAMQYGDEKFLSKKYTGDREDFSWGSNYNKADVEIKRLNVIYFLK